MHQPSEKIDAQLPLILLGGGGHARVLLDVARLTGRTVNCIFDDNPALLGSLIDGVEVRAGIDALKALSPVSFELINAVGSAGLPVTRRAVYDRGRSAGFSFATIVHPAAIVAQSAVIRPGVQILAGAVVGPGAVLAEDVVINTGATVDHDVSIKAHSHIAPGVTVCGGVSIGKGCHIGCGATLIQGVRIGDGVLIAAGAVVVADVEEGRRVAGVPARDF